ncbi:haloacid dehalogenase type II [Pseudomonas entomophila]|uniref:haloacid dehalogenase type II n=1 Tax=Pseudomonas sp. RIT-PI-S TaxID=3035295 RepID=UPI0021DAAA7E
MSEQVRKAGFLGFDVFGTVVDWRNGVARAAQPFLDRYAIDVDPLNFADEWRGLYQPSMQRVRSGERAFVTLDVLHRENLETVLARHNADFAAIRERDLVALNTAWERLDPWPDAVEGLTRLKSRFPIGPLSNGHIAGMLNLARFGGLPWDVITGAGLAQTYKPQPQAYLKSVAAVGLLPERTAMVAAHNQDLAAASATGMRTVFVRRPTEHGPAQQTDLAATGPWDIVAESLIEVAQALEC